MEDVAMKVNKNAKRCHRGTRTQRAKFSTLDVGLCHPITLLTKQPYCWPFKASRNGRGQHHIFISKLLLHKVIVLRCLVEHFSTTI